MIPNNHSLKGVFMYLPKNYFVSQKTPQFISTFFWIIDVPTSNLSNICLGLNPWTNLYNTIATIFLIFSCDFIRLKNEKTFCNASNTSYLSSLVLYAIQWFQLFPNEFFVLVQSKTCKKNNCSFFLTKQTKLDPCQNMMMHLNTKTLYLVRYRRNNSLVQLKITSKSIYFSQ